jgi:hypothetical protein
VYVVTGNVWYVTIRNTSEKQKTRGTVCHPLKKGI